MTVGASKIQSVGVKSTPPRGSQGGADSEVLSVAAM
jgi:hypothetical protein